MMRPALNSDGGARGWEATEDKEKNSLEGDHKDLGGKRPSARQEGRKEHGGQVHG